MSLRTSKVAPASVETTADVAAVEPTKVPRAPLLRRLLDIDKQIAEMKVAQSIDGFATLDLHAAAKCGDMREVARRLPVQHMSLSLRDEAGWMPIHHAAAAGRRCLFRVPCHSPQMVDLSEREMILDEVASLVEAQTVKLQQNTGEAADNNEVELSFSRQMEHLLNHHLVSECMHRTAPMLEDVAGASTIGSGATLASVAVGGTSARAGTPSTAAEANSSGLARRQGVSKRGVAVHQAVATEAALATTTSAGHLGSEAAARRAEAAAYRQLHDERPIGVWIEVKWVRPHREPSWARAAGDTHPNTTADVTGTSPHAVLEILLLQLHDSEYTDYVPRSEGVGRLLPNSPLDLAIAAVGRSLSVWAPSREALEAPFKLHEDEDEGERLNKRQQRSLLSGVMSRHAMKSVLRITSMSIVGEQLLDGARGALKVNRLPATRGADS